MEFHTTNNVIYPFQSLTGTIHTVNTIKNETNQNIVSIPHRYDSHILMTKLGAGYGASFNPSQVRFTPEQLSHCNLKVAFVSIPHRYDSHNIRGERLEVQII